MGQFVQQPVYAFLCLISPLASENLLVIMWPELNLLVGSHLALTLLWPLILIMLIMPMVP